MLKQDQLVLLPCHRQIGTVVTVNEEKAVIRVITPEENYDVIVTPEGLLPHTDVSLIENIIFKENEHIVVNMKDGSFKLCQIEKIFVETHNNISNLRIKVVDNQGNPFVVPKDDCEKLYLLKKMVDKRVSENDVFKRNKNV